MQSRASPNAPPMPINATCPHCHRPLRLADSALFLKAFPCPLCKQEMALGEPVDALHPTPPPPPIARRPRALTAALIALGTGFLLAVLTMYLVTRFGDVRLAQKWGTGLAAGTLLYAVVCFPLAMLGFWLVDRPATMSP